jgi:hypothetical protein
MGYLLRTSEAWELTPAGRPAKNFPNWWRLEDHLGKNAVIVYDGKHYPQEMPILEEAFERIDAPEQVVVPRVMFLGLGDKEKYFVMNAWNYRGPKRVERPAAPSED